MCSGFCLPFFATNKSSLVFISCRVTTHLTTMGNRPPKGEKTSTAPSHTSSTTTTRTNAATSAASPSATVNSSAATTARAPNPKHVKSTKPPKASSSTTESALRIADGEELTRLTQAVRWRPLCEDSSIETLKKLEGALNRAKVIVRSELNKKLRKNRVLKSSNSPNSLPTAPAKLLSGDYKSLSPQHRKLIQQTTSYILEIAPKVHENKELRDNLRRLLGLNYQYTMNLGWASSFKTLVNGCKDHLVQMGLKIDDFYRVHNLRRQFMDYHPVPHDVDPASLRQLVPAECREELFGGSSTLSVNYDRECTYVHYLRLLGLALDTSFPLIVSDKLASAGIANYNVSSGGIKSFERMINKMYSKKDHRYCLQPRPAQNTDVVRCLVTFETADDMRRGSEVRCQVENTPSCCKTNNYFQESV